ncbi:MAG: O-antigen ligase family protein [bacterium]
MPKQTRNTIYFFQLILAALIAVGILPRYYSFFIALAAGIYIYFADKTDALWFLIASIPLYIALPFSKSFDTSAYWRILFIEYFIILALKNKEKIVKKAKEIKKDLIARNFTKIFKEYKIEILMTVLFLLSIFSLVGAENKALGIKRIAYFGNFFIFYLILVYGINSLSELKNALRGLAASAGIFVFVGFLQLFSMYFTSYQNFWSFWAGKVIPVFYGQKLAEFVSFNNAWFAFSLSGQVSLRMFSLFSDAASIAFAMAMICFTVIPLSFYFFSEGDLFKKKFFTVISLALVILGIILSGSRGAWVSIIFAAGFALFVAVLKKTTAQDRAIYVKNIILMCVLFLLLFPMSPLLLGAKDISTTSLGRIRTIQDESDVSNKNRIEVWKTSLKTLKEHPFFGVGVANFSAEPEKFGENFKTASHNMYLYIACEMGIPALLVVLVLIFYLFKDLIAEFHTAEDKFLKMFYLSLGAAAAWVFGLSLSIDCLLNVDKMTLIFLSFIGIFYASKRIVGRTSDFAGIVGGNVVQ